MGAIAHLGNGNLIPNSAIAFENGKITMVADATTIRYDRTKYAKIYDATGKHVYPGFIATNTSVGLIEIDAVRATQDNAENGVFNPNARAIIAYNADSEIPPTLRTNGILMAQTCPDGTTIAGTSAVVQLDAWNWEDALIKEDGVHLNWPAQRRFGGFGGGGNYQAGNGGTGAATGTGGGANSGSGGGGGGVGITGTDIFTRTASPGYAGGAGGSGLVYIAWP
jgi:hypothetical protein